MNTNRLSARPALGWLFTLLLLGAVGALWPSTAHAADNSVASSTPADGSTLEASPTSISITFAQPLGTSNQLVLTCGGATVPTQSPIVLRDNLTLEATLVAVAPKGDCVVAWSVTDATLQPAGSGNIAFTVASDPPPETVPVTTEPPTTGATIVPPSSSTLPGAVTPEGGDTETGNGTGTVAEPTGSKGPLGLFRLASNLSLAVLFGSLVLIAIAWPEGVEYILTVRFLRSTWIVTLVATYLFAASLAANQTGSGLGSVLNPMALTDLLDSTPGKAAFLRLLLVAASAYAVLRPERVIDPSSQMPALVIPGLAVVTMAFSRAEFGLIEYAMGAVHGLAMSVWFGGLVLLWRVVLAGPGEEDLVHAVRGFARLANMALWATVGTGAVLLFQLDRGHLGSSHGLVVIVKTLFVSLMVFVGVAARQFISQRVARVDNMTAPLANRLRKALGVEMLVGVVVLTLTAWLLALTPPGLGVAANSSLQLGTTYQFQNATTGVDIRVAFSERVGTNDVRIEVVSPTEGLTGLTVDFLPPPGSFVSGMTINRIPLAGKGVAVLEKSDGFVLSASGSWTVVVSVNGAEVQRQVVVVGGSVDTDDTTSDSTTTTSTTLGT
jgi:copper transport protein